MFSSPIFRSRLLFTGACTFLFGVLSHIALAQNTPIPPPQKTQPTPPLVFFTAIPPIQWLMESLGAPHIRAVSLVGARQNHEMYEPKPSQLKNISKAQGYASLRLPFEEKWAQRFKSLQPQGIYIDLLAGITTLPLAHHDHDHDHGHQHGKKTTPATEEVSADPHIWLSPAELNLSAKKLVQVFSQAMPEHRADFERNLTQWQARLADKERALQSALAQSGSALIADHPNWGYLARQYNLTMINLEEGDRELSPKELQDINRGINEGKIRYAFLERAPAGFLRGGKVKIIALNPSQADVFQTFDAIIKGLQAQKP